jgi:hypothetical protein
MSKCRFYARVTLAILQLRVLEYLQGFVKSE